MNAPETMARAFHEAYERLAPAFGYTTREDTRAFDLNSPNGKLMIAVCADLYDAQAAEIADLRRQLAEAQAENFRLKDRVHRLQRSYMEGPNE